MSESNKDVLCRGKPACGGCLLCEDRDLRAKLTIARNAHVADTEEQASEIRILRAKLAEAEAERDREFWSCVYCGESMKPPAGARAPIPCPRGCADPESVLIERDEYKAKAERLRSAIAAHRDGMTKGIERGQIEADITHDKRLWAAADREGG